MPREGNVKVTDDFRDFLLVLGAVAFGWIFSALLSMPLMAWIRFSVSREAPGIFELLISMYPLYLIGVSAAVGVFIGIIDTRRTVLLTFFALVPLVAMLHLPGFDVRSLAYGALAIVTGCFTAFLAHRIRHGKSPIGPKTMIAIIIVQAAALLVLFGLYRKTHYEIEGDIGIGWKNEVRSLTGYYGTREAKDDFSKGIVRLYQLDKERRESTFSGKKDGPYEVWNHSYYPSLGEPSRYSEEMFVHYYNAKMRHLVEHKSATK